VKSLGGVKVISIDKNKLLKELKKISKSIKKENKDVCNIRIFGSIAKEEEIGTSDLDILIILKDTKEEMIKRCLKYRKYFNIPIAVDVLVFTKKEIKKMTEDGNFFVQNILKESFPI